MNTEKFDSALRAIDAMIFEDSKVNAAKDLIQSSAMTSDQVLKIMESFQFENSKIEFAQFAFPMITDKENYRMVDSIFELKSTREKFNQFLKTNLGWYN